MTREWVEWRELSPRGQTEEEKLQQCRGHFRWLGRDGRGIRARSEGVIDEEEKRARVQRSWRGNEVWATAILCGIRS